MKKITQPKKIWSLITGFLFISIIFSTASTTGLTAPVITVDKVDDVLCPADMTGAIVISASGGTGIYTYEWTKGGSIYPTSQTETLNNLSPGIYQVRVTDISDGSSITSEPIEVKATDAEAPVITVTDIDQTTDPGVCSKDLTLSPPSNLVSVSDNCSVGAPSGTRNDGLLLADPYPVGTTTIEWNVTDDNGNVADPVIQNITVTDNEKPVIDQPTDLEANNIPGTCEAVVTVTTPNITENCGIRRFFPTRKDGKNISDPYPVGTTVIMWKSVDVNGNWSRTVEQKVIISDTTSPEIIAEDISVSTDDGECFATVVMTATAQDNCSVGAPSGTRNDGLLLSEPYPVGTTTIEWNVTDEYGNVADPVIQNITITDNERPVIDQPTDLEANNIPGTCEGVINVTVPNTTDNCGAGAAFPSREDGRDISDTYPIGTTAITWNAQDVNGNWAEPVIQKITIIDNELPVIPTLPDIKTSCEITLVPPTTSDNCTPSEEIKVTTNDPLTYKPQNTITQHVITWRFEDASGNITEAKQNLTINPLIASTSSTAVTCNGGNDGTITIEASGGEPQYTYAIDDGNFGSANSFSGLSAGIHFAKVKDLTGCIISEEIEITQPAPLQYTPPADNIKTTTTPESCFGSMDGTITINGSLSGGNGIYEFSVDNTNFSGNPITGLRSGEYTVFIRDSNGCRLSYVIPTVVEGPDIMEAVITPGNPSCYNSDSGFIEVSDPRGGNDTDYSFRINGGPWQSNSNSTGYTFTGLVKGTYAVEMRDSSGCIRLLENVTLTEPDEILPNVSTTRTTTYGSTTGTATANTTGGDETYSFKWRNLSGGTVGNDTQTITGLKAGLYEVTVTDGQGCIGVEQFEVFDKVTTQISAISLCKNTDDTIRTSTFQVDLDNTMGGEGDPQRFTYVWDFGEGASLPSGTTGIGPHEVSYSVTGDKTITLTITDEGGVTFTHVSNHYVGACFELCDSANNFTSDKNSFFLGDIDGNRMITSECDLSEPMYLWFIVDKSANGYILNSEFVYTVTSNNITKQYQATNCFSNPGEAQLEPGQLVRLNEVGPGDNQIHWNCDEVLNIIHITYRWTVNPGKACGQTNNNHCASTNETMSVAAPIRGLAEVSGTCFGQSQGSIIVEAYGGTGDFSYLAVNTETLEEFNSNINVINDLPAGTYSLTITDNKEVAEGQEKNYFTINDIVVDEPDSGLTAKVRFSDITCNGDQNGWAEVYDVQGGTPFIQNGLPTYEYIWNDPARQTTAKAENLGENSYTVTIIDSLGCTLVKSVSIAQPPALTIANAGPDQTKCGFTSTTLEANTAVSGNGKWSISSSMGGTATIDNVYDPKSGFQVIDDDGDGWGRYTLNWTITNTDGTCSSTDELVITIIEDCTYLDFDGLDDYIDFGSEPYNFDTGNYSIEAWVKLKTTSGTRTILSKRDANNSSLGGYELVVTSGGLPGFKIGDGIIFPDNSIPLNTQRWYHIAVVFDGSGIKFYIDGIQVNSVQTINNQQITNPAATAAPFIIGATYDSSSNRRTKPSTHFYGWIEEVRLWKKALNSDQIQFMMNQRLENNGGLVKGKELPLNVPGPLLWSDMTGYYQLLAEEAKVGGGSTQDRSNTPVPGKLKNITSLQENTAPLPYVSVRDGNWRDIETTTTPWLHGRGRWDAPNSLGVNQQPIDWNIVRVSHNIESGNSNIKVLGLLSEANEISVFDPNFLRDEYNPGHSITVSHFLRLNGSIDLDGESQLLQDEGSILEESSSGYIERDQQGTASSFNYNYWSSPVSPQGSPNNAPYTIESVLRDGTDPANPGTINYKYQYHYADQDYPEPLRISSYWLFKYTNFQSNTYSEWLHVGETGTILTGEGYTMKGTSGSATITDRQNYTFVGKPHNGTISHTISLGNDYLIGNPYPSAIDSHKFILDNIKGPVGNNTKNVFNGALYFWDHFAGKTHYLKEYVGGYATLTLAGGIEAIANDERINATGEHADINLNPQRYIPVGQAFFVSTQLSEELTGLTTVSGGDIIFKNSQRVFETEHQIDDESIFKSKENKEAEKGPTDTRSKIYLRYISPEGYQRQLLVTKDPNTSGGFDLGYDAPLIENVDEDMYWLIHDVGFVIQGVPDFEADRELPLTVKVHHEGEFSISIDKLENIPADLEIHIKDTLAGATYDLRKSAFTSTEPVGSIVGRFKLVFPNFEVVEESPEGEPESIYSYYSSEETKVTIENPYLIPINSAILYNINGQKLTEYKDIPLEKLTEIPIGQRASGVYILKLQMDNESKSVKFIVE